jgi:hypothetical protein
MTMDATAWDWADFSRKPWVTAEPVSAHPDRPWDWTTLTRKPWVTTQLTATITVRYTEQGSSSDCDVYATAEDDGDRSQAMLLGVSCQVAPYPQWQVDSEAGMQLVAGLLTGSVRPALVFNGLPSITHAGCRLATSNWTSGYTSYIVPAARRLPQDPNTPVHLAEGPT